MTVTIPIVCNGMLIHLNVVAKFFCLRCVSTSLRHSNELFNEFFF
jgi:hypothetical protein